MTDSTQINDKQRIHFRNVWSSGNYDNAYVGKLNPQYSESDQEYVVAAYLLGYFSSYENHEVSEEYDIEAIRSRWNSVADSMGIVTQ